MSEFNSFLPIVYGFLSGITVFIGSYFIMFFKKFIGRRFLGILNSMSGGILAYLALESGYPPALYIESIARFDTINQFLAAAILTTFAFFIVWFTLSSIEGTLRRSKGRRFGGREVALIAAIALGIHNIGEGFAIAGSFLAGEINLMIVFTIGFAVHNATEGFAISSPLLQEGSRHIFKFVTILSLIAGLPTVLGASTYFLGTSELIMATLYTVATASIVYAMLMLISQRCQSLEELTLHSGFHY